MKRNPTVCLTEASSKKCKFIEEKQDFKNVDIDSDDPMAANIVYTQIIKIIEANPKKTQNEIMEKLKVYYHSKSFDFTVIHHKYGQTDTYSTRIESDACSQLLEHMQSQSCNYVSICTFTRKTVLDWNPGKVNDVVTQLGADFWDIKICQDNVNTQYTMKEELKQCFNSCCLLASALEEHYIINPDRVQYIH